MLRTSRIICFKFVPSIERYITEKKILLYRFCANEKNVRFNSMKTWKHSFEFKREILRKIISNEFYENCIHECLSNLLFLFFSHGYSRVIFVTMVIYIMRLKKEISSKKFLAGRWSILNFTSYDTNSAGIRITLYEV